MAYTVKQAAKLAGVSVRTLHHYDHIGLLKPSDVSAAGYRLYDEDDLARLQQILFFRELGFELKAIGPILDRPGFDRRESLKLHRRMLLERQRRLQTLLTTLDRTIESLEKEAPMSTEELFAGFDESERKQLIEWQDEAKQRWGETEAYRQSAARTKGYTKVDWDAIKAEQEAIQQGFADLSDRDVADPEVQALVDRHYRQINERFYDLPIPMFRNLGRMLGDDPRYAKNYDKRRPGTAAFVREAIAAYCDARS